MVSILLRNYTFCTTRAKATQNTENMMSVLQEYFPNFGTSKITIKKFLEVASYTVAQGIRQMFLPKDIITD